jgi:predicted acylesterase/phospholipase RssA
VVIWDLGAIASSMRTDRVQRFQDAILASIAVPVVMPVRYIETGQPGTYAMHVDGSFLAPLFMTTLLGNFKDVPGNFDVYVVVNNRLKRPQPLELLKPRLVELAPRLFYLVHTSQFERTIDVLLLQSHIHEWHLIKLKFSCMSMFSDVLTCFLSGFGQAWIPYPPRLAPANATT